MFQFILIRKSHEQGCRSRNQGMWYHLILSGKNGLAAWLLLIWFPIFITLDQSFYQHYSKEETSPWYFKLYLNVPSWLMLASHPFSSIAFISWFLLCPTMSIRMPSAKLLSASSNLLRFPISVPSSVHIYLNQTYLPWFVSRNTIFFQLIS